MASENSDYDSIDKSNHAYIFLLFIVPPIIDALIFSKQKGPIFEYRFDKRRNHPRW